MKVYLESIWDKPILNQSNDYLLLLLIEKAFQTKISIVDKAKDSDIVLFFPHLTKKKEFEIKSKLFFYKKIGVNATIEKLFGFPHKNILAVSHENLDAPTHAFYRHLILKNNLKRLTFWPKEIDPGGCRFPHWWMYVQLDGYNLSKKAHSRYGKSLSLEKLLRPFKQNKFNSDRICILARNFEFPRNNLLDNIEKNKLDIYGSGNLIWKHSKNELLKTYKYNFCAENSCGYGYETEKLPEAWDSGSIPYNYIRNPFSDFTDELFVNNILNESRIFDYPLLKNEPDLIPLIRYIQNAFK